MLIVLTDEGLPFTSGPAIASKKEIGLETHFTLGGKRRLDLTSVVSSSGESSTLQEDFEENLGVEGEGSRVEGDGLDGRVNVVSTSDSVRSKQVDQVVGAEASIGHTREDGVDIALGQRDGAVRSCDGCIRATCKELELRSTRAVRTIIFNRNRKHSDKRERLT